MFWYSPKIMRRWFLNFQEIWWKMYIYSVRFGSFTLFIRNRSMANKRWFTSFAKRIRLKIFYKGFKKVFGSQLIYLAWWTKNQSKDGLKKVDASLCRLVVGNLNMMWGTWEKWIRNVTQDKEVRSPRHATTNIMGATFSPISAGIALYQEKKNWIWCAFQPQDRRSCL